jgi:hypothetical protein
VNTDTPILLYVLSHVDPSIVETMLTSLQARLRHHGHRGQLFGPTSRMGASTGGLALARHGQFRAYGSPPPPATGPKTVVLPRRKKRDKEKETP